jgi:hypothetical protein
MKFWLINNQIRVGRMFKKMIAGIFAFLLAAGLGFIGREPDRFPTGGAAA